MQLERHISSIEQQENASKIKGEGVQKCYKTRDDVQAGGITWEQNKREEDGRKKVGEMRMFWWMCSVINEGRISNARIRGTVKVGKRVILQTMVWRTPYDVAVLAGVGNQNNTQQHNKNTTYAGSLGSITVCVPFHSRGRLNFQWLRLAILGAMPNVSLNQTKFHTHSIIIYTRLL